jgi:hypothetical protein
VDEASKYPGFDVQSVEEARRSDAAPYAEQLGISVDEAVRRLERQDALFETIFAAERLVPDRFAGGWIEHEPEQSIVVRFTGGDSGLEAATALLHGAGVPVKVDTSALHTVDELEAGRDQITQTIYKDHPDTGFYPDVKTGSVRLLGPTKIGPDELQALSALAGVPVTARTTSGPAEPGHTYGGRMIDGSLRCTTGFTTKDAVSGIYGVLTAGHCANQAGSTYYQTSTLWYFMTRGGMRFDANQDFSWHYENNHLVYPIYWNGSAYREVWETKPRLEMVNFQVLHYGITTGRSNGVVDSIQYNPGSGYPSCPCDPVWGVIDNDPTIKCAKGDSGGPMFWAEEAWGLYSGQTSTGTGEGQCDLLLFMTIGALNWDGVNTRVYEAR